MKLTKTLKFSVGILLMGCASCSTREQINDLSVMHLNIWMNAKVVDNGFSQVVNEIVRVDPDIVMFSEARNRENDFCIPALLDSLQAHGKVYYGMGSGLDVQMISKYPVLEQEHIVDQQNGSMRSILDINGRKVAVYTAHLDYTHYECYLPRGYSGTTWKKIDAPVTDPDTIMKANDESYRDDAIRLIIEDAKTQDADIILLGGDFNEPSHLDWGEDTKDLWDHNGAVVPWSCSSLLYEAGFRDAYREKYPDPKTHPGFTFPSDNSSQPVSKLTWAPEADERDRIDFIYFVPAEGLSVEEAVIVGPSRSIVRGERVQEQTMDIFSEPSGTWPTDHKGVLIKFKYK